MTMNTFHTGGVAGTGINASGIARIDQLLKMPKIVAGAAKLSPIDGLVTSIKPGVGGGHDVTITTPGNEKIHIKTPQGRVLKVSVGSRVKKGDVLNEGPIKPQELVEQKGMLPAQQYLVNELQKEYKSQGPSISAKMFETLVRSISDTTVVTNNARESKHIPGDITSYNALRKYNNNLTSELDVEEALDHVLAERVGPLQEGHELTQKDVELLKSMGHKKVKVKREAVEHQPVLKNITTLPVLKSDWLASLGYRDLKRAIIEAASQGKKTDIHGYNPIPAYAFGKEFGEGEDGKY